VLDEDIRRRTIGSNGKSGIRAHLNPGLGAAWCGNRVILDEEPDLVCSSDQRAFLFVHRSESKRPRLCLRDLINTEHYGVGAANEAAASKP